MPLIIFYKDIYKKKNMINQIVKFQYLFQEELCLNSESFIFISNNISSNDIYYYLLELINVFANIFTSLVGFIFLLFYYLLRILVSTDSKRLANILTIKEYINFLHGKKNKQWSFFRLVFYAFLKIVLSIILLLFIFIILLYVYLIIYMIINQSLMENLINFNLNYYYIGILEYPCIFLEIENLGLNYSTENRAGEIIPSNNSSINSSNIPNFSNNWSLYTNSIFYNEITGNIHRGNPHDLINLLELQTTNGAPELYIDTKSSYGIEHSIKIIRDTSNSNNISIHGYVQISNRFLTITPNDESQYRFYRTLYNIFEYKSTTNLNINYINELNNTLLPFLNHSVFLESIFPSSNINYSFLNLNEKEQYLKKIKILNELYTIQSQLNLILKNQTLDDTLFSSKLNGLKSLITLDKDLQIIEYSKFKNSIIPSELDTGYALNAETILTTLNDDSIYYYLIPSWNQLEFTAIRDYPLLEFGWEDSQKLKLLPFDPNKLTIAVNLEVYYLSDEDSDSDSEVGTAINLPDYLRKFRFNIVDPILLEQRLDYWADAIRSKAILLNKHEANTALLELKIKQWSFYFRLFNTSALLALEVDLNNALEYLIKDTNLNLDSVPTLYNNNISNLRLLS